MKFWEDMRQITPGLNDKLMIGEKATGETGQSDIGNLPFASGADLDEIERALTDGLATKADINNLAGGLIGSSYSSIINVIRITSEPSTPPYNGNAIVYYHPVDGWTYAYNDGVGRKIQLSGVGEKIVFSNAEGKFYYLKSDGTPSEIDVAPSKATMGTADDNSILKYDAITKKLEQSGLSVTRSGTELIIEINDGLSSLLKFINNIAIEASEITLESSNISLPSTPNATSMNAGDKILISQGSMLYYATKEQVKDWLNT